MKKRSWSDITVADFQRIYELQQNNDEEKLLRLIALVNGMGMEEIYTMPLSKLESHFQDIDFLTKEPQIPLMKPSYILNGTKYNVYAGEMLTAQYIDLKQIIDRYYENLPQLLSLFLIPAGHKYADGYDLGKAMQDISSMAITDARAVASFFLTACGILTRLSLRSSVRRLRRMARKAKGEEKNLILQAARETEKVIRKNQRPTTG